MKKAFLVVLINFCFLLNAYAANDFLPFTTLELAQQYCPALNSLNFDANTESPTSAGTIRAMGRAAFQSIPVKTAVHPKNMNPESFIADAQFRSSEGMYGYLSNNVATCFYLYLTIYNSQYYLVMREVLY